MQFESPFAAGLNFLLESEPWARERLAPFAGEALELRAPPLPALCFIIAADGSLAAARSGASADAKSSLIIRVGPGALAAAVKGEEHLLRAVEVEGNARLAKELMFLARHLRWDVEEEVAQVVGDIAAHRLVGFARGVAAWQVDAARRFAEALLEYATEENPLLATRTDLSEIVAAGARLRDGLERLEKRIARLQG